MNRRAWMAGLSAMTAPALLPYPTRNLMQWLDTQQGAANFANGGNTWRDLSGNNRHATVPSGWTAPQLVTNPANGMRALYPANGMPSGHKSRYTVPQTVFVFQVLNLPAFPDQDVWFLCDDIDTNNYFGLYTNAGIYKIAKGGSYGNYPPMVSGFITMAWDGLQLAVGNTDFYSTGIGNPYWQSPGWTIGTVKNGAVENTPPAYRHLWLVYSERPTDAEIADLVAAAKNNFSIPA